MSRRLVRQGRSGADLNIRYQVTVSQLSTSEKPTSASLHVAAATANGLSILNLNSSTWIPAGTADKAWGNVGKLFGRGKGKGKGKGKASSLTRLCLPPPSLSHPLPNNALSITFSVALFSDIPSRPPSTSCSPSLLPLDMSARCPRPSTCSSPHPHSPKGLSEPSSERDSHISLPSLRFPVLSIPPSPPPGQMPSSFYVLVTTPAFPKGAL
ncbi:unnamed protein product [Closterium sp. Naga37s-1]|nr:unnamed protein product [Closterium sp. Naga37s-1]